MTALPHSLNEMRALRRVRRAGAAFMLLVSLFGGCASADEPVKGEVTVFTDGGYARLVFRLDEVVEASVGSAGGILVIAFKKPVAIAVDRISGSAADYISAARRDPDGNAIRLALARKVKVNLIPAGERLYVDIMPDNWKGMLPSLPQDVVNDLARRASEAERQLRQQRLAAKQAKPQTIRVKVASQPTFTRYVFDMPDNANVVPEQREGRLVLSFDQPIKWDFADAKAAMPASLESVDAETDFDSVEVVFVLNGTPTVRTFRENRSIVVDVGLDGTKPKEMTDKPAAPERAAKVTAAPETAPAIEPPETVPAKDAPAPEPSQKAASPSPPADIPAPAKAAEAKTAEPPPAAAPAPKEAAKPAATERVRPAPNPNAAVVVAVTRSGDNLRVEFPFSGPTPAAVFRRGDVLWLVFDSSAKIDLATLTTETSDLIRGATLDARQRRRGHPAHSPGAAAARQPRRRRSGLDCQYRRHRQRADTSARHRARHRRQGAREHRHSIRGCAQGPSCGRSRRR